MPTCLLYTSKNPGERILSGVIEITTSLGGAKVNVTPRAAPAPAPTPNPRPENKGRLDS